MLYSVSTFGEWLKKHRVNAGLSLRALERKIDNICSFAFLDQLERDIRGKKGQPVKPDIAIVDALAKAFQVSIDEARLAAGYAPAKPFTKPATIEELADALNALGLPVPQAPFPLDPDGEGFREMIERMYLDMQLVIDRMRRGRKSPQLVDMVITEVPEIVSCCFVTG